MLWFWLALTGAVLEAAYYAVVKKYAAELDKYVLAGGIFWFSFMAVLPLVVWRGVPSLGEMFIPALSVVVLIGVVAAILYYQALPVADFSKAFPLLSFSEVFLVVTAMLLLGERPNMVGFVGIVLIVVGNVMANWKRSPKAKAKHITAKVAGYMLLVALLYSLANPFRKIAVINSDPLFYSAMFYLVSAISFAGIILAKKINPVGIVKANWRVMVGGGLILGWAGIVVNYAVTLQILAYVISVKRLSILFSVLIGAWWFGEKEIWRRLAGALVVFSGVVLIAVAG